MTTITIDDKLINKVISISSLLNLQDSVVTILSEYLRQYKNQTNMAELLAMPDVADIDFDPASLTIVIHPAYLS